MYKFCTTVHNIDKKSSYAKIAGIPPDYSYPNSINIYLDISLLNRYTIYMGSTRMRCIWVDHLKAFLIFTIVAEHMAHYVFHDTPNIYITIISSFNLATFFFLSGMFASPVNHLAKIVKGVVALLVPFLSVGTIWTLCVLQRPWETLFTNGMHNGLWFIWTLLTLRLIFPLRNALAHYLRELRYGSIISDIAVIASVEIICFIAQTNAPSEIVNMCSLGMLHSFTIYYFMGYWYMENILKKNREIPSSIVEESLLLLFAALIVEYYFSSGIIARVCNLVQAVCGTVVIVEFFRSLPVLFIGSKWVQFIGRHTLEIYVGHYFLIPVGISTICMPIIESGEGITIVFYSCIAVTIIAIMSVALYFIDKHPVLNFLLFGKIHFNKKS